jgi:DNA-binding protein H-NS
MKNTDHLESLSVDELWDLHEEIVAELSRKIEAEKAMLEERLRRLGKAGKNPIRRAKRPYPKVSPKYRNPKNRGETWAGRGKQPRWLAAQLRSGRKIDDFLIRKSS